MFEYCDRKLDISMRNGKHFSVLIHCLAEVLFFIQLFYVLPKCRADCEIHQPANLNDSKRETELLNIIKPLTGLVFDVKDAIAPTEFTYKISICGHIEGSEPHVAAMQFTKDNKSFPLGMNNNVNIMGGTDWILLSYFGGSKYSHHCNGTDRVTQIMIVCDPDVLKGKLEILEERKSNEHSNCYYLFELNSNVSCAVKTSEVVPNKLSSGSVFCILFFTVVSVYLICGFLYKRIVIGAKGLEQIPNYSFWRDFGNLQADGCDYICRWGPRQESQAYRGIDDHLKIDEDRDDQLLNM
ncbi:unnamed protein product [Larinioides sclopetarius]|uniref:MRH domain-containing protein n=1 Tax=Larinioides sclopetarius TaxID=280406 RepID=A0AAV1Z9N6_9ARAC